MKVTSSSSFTLPPGKKGKVVTGYLAPYLMGLLRGPGVPSGVHSTHDHLSKNSSTCHIRWTGNLRLPTTTGQTKRMDTAGNPDEANGRSRKCRRSKSIASKEEVRCVH